MLSITSTPDWASLVANALCLILDKLLGRKDHVRFGAVCKNWYSVAKLHHQNPEFTSQVLPMLPIPTESKSTGLFGIATKRVYNVQWSFPGVVCGFSHGWLATTDPTNDYVITLMNPFNKAADPIRLPPIKHAGPTPRVTLRAYVKRLTLSADPITSPSDYMVAAIVDSGCHLAFIRAGQEFWTYIFADQYEERRLNLTDISFYKGIVYAVGPLGGWSQPYSTIVYLDPSNSAYSCGGEHITRNIFPRDESYVDEYFLDDFPATAYLVKSLEGDQWIVERSFGDDFWREHTHRFHVYKLELDDKSGKHGKVKPLQKLELNSQGDNVLFVSDYSDSMSVSASYFSDCLRKDSIYFTDYNGNKIRLRIFNVRDGTASKGYSFKHSFEYSYEIPTQLKLWVAPQIQFKLKV